MNKSLLKYILGLSVIGLFTLVMLVIVIVQAVATRQDKVTYKAAVQAAEKINKYIDEKDKIPKDFPQAGIESSNDNIKFEKLSEEKFKFCVTYRASSGYMSKSIESTVMSAMVGGGYSAGSSRDEYESSELYVDESHEKGENCQTIKPYISSSYDGYGDNDYDRSYGSEGSGSYYRCSDAYNQNIESPTAMEDYYACMEDNQ